VLLKIAYLLVRRILGLAVLMLRGQGAKEAELLVLQHENAVLRRHVGRIRYEPADLWFAALAPLLPTPALDRHLPRDARDAAGLAPQTGSEKVRHERAAQARPSADGPRHRPPCHSPREGEPAVGTPPKIRPGRPDQRVHARRLTPEGLQVTYPNPIFERDRIGLPVRLCGFRRRV
jgi:hypothetical protein